MIARAGSGWQYALADLSLILFMVTAATLAHAGEQPLPVRASAQGEPLALWRPGSGAPPLQEWLAAQSPDPRQQLTIVARYAAGEQAGALAQAQALAVSAGDAGVTARIIIEPGEGGVAATLAHDVPAEALAHSLPEAATIPSHWSRP